MHFKKKKHFLSFKTKKILFSTLFLPMITFSNNVIDLKTKDLKNLYEEDFILQKPFITSEQIQEEMKENNIFNHIKIYNDEITLNDFLLTSINDLNYSLIPFSTTEIDHIGFMDKGSCFSSNSLKNDHISQNQLIKLKEINIEPLNSITQRLSIDKCEKENQQKNKHGDLVIKTYNSFFLDSNYSSKEKDLISSFFNPKITIADNWTSGYEMETEWFKNNNDIKFWNNSYTLPMLDRHSPLKYENVINNMANKIKNEDNFFVFGLGNQISGVQLNAYKLEQKIKEFFYNYYSTNKTNYILNNLKDKLIENTNTFYSISQKLLPNDLKNNKSILFVGGYDQVNHHIWDDIAETYYNNSINLLENEDFLYSKLDKKEFYKGGSNFCLLAKENCLLADMSLLLNKKNNKGTSFSTPRVLYGAYILKKVFPFLTNDQLGWLILSNATNINPKLSVPNEIYGYGVLNLNKSLKLFSKMNNLELQMDNNHFSKLKTSFKESNYKNIKIYTFGNDLTGNLFLKPLKTEKNNAEISITNFKSQEKNNNHSFNLKIGKNNIVIFQNDLKNTFIENDGTIFLSNSLKNKQIIKTNIKNKGKIYFINFKEVNIANLIKQLNK